MIWFGWVLWHINHCRLFNAKSSLDIYIKYIGFGLVGFYGITEERDCQWSGIDTNITDRLGLCDNDFTIEMH